MSMVDDDFPLHCVFRNQTWATSVMANLDSKGAQPLDVLLTLGYHFIQGIVIHVAAKVVGILSEICL